MGPKKVKRKFDICQIMFMWSVPVASSSLQGGVIVIFPTNGRFLGHPVYTTKRPIGLYKQ